MAPGPVFILTAVLYIYNYYKKQSEKTVKRKNIENRKDACPGSFLLG